MEICKLFSRCLNVLIPQNGGKNGLMIKLLVEVELMNPLLRGTKMKLENESVWVDFRSEKLPTFGFIVD